MTSVLTPSIHHIYGVYNLSTCTWAPQRHAELFLPSSYDLFLVSYLLLTSSSLSVRGARLAPPGETGKPYIARSRELRKFIQLNFRYFFVIFQLQIHV